MDLTKLEVPGIQWVDFREVSQATIVVDRPKIRDRQSER
jgi:hypothetical protein